MTWDRRKTGEMRRGAGRINFPAKKELQTTSTSRSGSVAKKIFK